MLVKGICLKDTKEVKFFSKKYAHLEWTEERDDNSK